MRDFDVRAAVHRGLAADHEGQPDTLFVDELGLRGQVRVDVAVVNGALSGFELKSASDTLRRLPLQVEVYSQVLDYATLVVADNHLEASARILPEWWGVVVARWCEGRVELERFREPVRNPAVDPMALAELLWREEALEILEELGLATGVRSKPRAVLWDRLVKAIDVETLGEHVRGRLKARQGWRSAP